VAGENSSIFFLAIEAIHISWLVALPPSKSATVGPALLTRPHYVLLCLHQACVKILSMTLGHQGNPEKSSWMKGELARDLNSMLTSLYNV
jgi:hypothetical protein